MVNSLSFSWHCMICMLWRYTTFPRIICIYVTTSEFLTCKTYFLKMPMKFQVTFMNNHIQESFILLHLWSLKYSLLCRHRCFIQIAFDIVHPCVSVHNANAYKALSNSQNILHLTVISVLLLPWSLMSSLLCTFCFSFMLITFETVHKCILVNVHEVVSDSHNILHLTHLAKLLLCRLHWPSLPW